MQKPFSKPAFKLGEIKKKFFPNLSFKESAFGWDGLSTFIFSNVLLVASFGFAFVFIFLRTLKIARHTGTAPASLTDLSNTVLVAGLRLENNSPADEFKIRLNRVAALFQNRTENGQIIILGGLTGGNTLSEAQAGANYLIAQGMNAQHITTEDHSRHTLENLQNARSLLINRTSKESQSLDPSVETDAFIISSRYHLHRIVTLAKGLSMTLQPIAAEENFSLSLVNLLRLFKEAYYLHWYWSGKIWVFITVNKKSQARIS